MAAMTVVERPPEYGDYVAKLSWDLHELSFRIKAALEVLHGLGEEIDLDSEKGLTLTYVLRGAAERAEHLAIASSETAYAYVQKSAPVETAA
ncbi:hypothetical protein [Ideonella sp.]|uniref:hypothetical protein n=1 Tax=Ideonella sp. TaxID=1929293 RepID=UPI003BB58D5A